MRHDKRAAALYRLFFALKPPVTVARQTDHLAEKLGGGERRIRLEHQHMTLAVTADYVEYPYAVIKALLRAGTGVEAEPFDMRLDQLSFSNRSVALRPSRSVPLLNQLQRSIADAMWRAGVALRPGWSFSPHQTLFYRDGPPSQQSIDGFSWSLDRFVLVCSHVGRTRHDILGTWTLKGDGQYELF
jgi:RNA 2',3'-cyclic 3'-phosphodiesterase